MSANGNGNGKKKSTDISAELAKAEVGELVPMPHGGALRNGGTNKGGTGRPPNVFRQKLKELRARPEVLKFFKECLDGEHGPAAALKALEFASDRIDGKVPSVTTVQGGDEPLTVVILNGG